MIGSLTAVTILSQGGGQPLAAQLLYILVPSLIGFLGYTLTRRYALAFLSHAPAVRRMLDDQIEAAQAEQVFADVEQLRGVSWRSRLLQLAIPLACVLGYLLWTGSGVHQQAIRQLMMPVSAKGWLLILPYALLVPLLLMRDPLQLRRLQRKLG